MPSVEIRRATPDDCGRLTAIAVAAKASWGYDNAFMALCEDELTMTPEKLAARQVWVAETGGLIVGLIALSVPDAGDCGELEEFFVDPPFQRRGIGRMLFAQLLGACRLHNLRRLELNSDPLAEKIYAKLGFSTFGRAPSGSVSGRFLPRMALTLAGLARMPGPD